MINECSWQQDHCPTAGYLPIKNPLSCWNSEEQDRGDVPLPREVRGDNDMDTGDAFALLREKIQWLGIRD